MSSNLQQAFDRIMAAGVLEEDEREVVMWQLCIGGDFKTALWHAVILADDDNLAKLAKGFPEIVSGLHKWREGNLGQKLRGLGLPL